jgi:uncharacterized protein YlxW (UPF0749 family)
VTRLYDLAAEYAAVQQAAEEGGDALALLDEIAGDIEAKGAGIVRVLANLEADAEACGAESRRLSDKGKSASQQAERLRNYVRTCMLTAGVTKIKGPTFSITLSAGRDKVEVYDLEALEEAAPELVRTTEEKAADKTAILARYKNDGECLPGVRIEPTTTLRIR